MSPQSQFVMRLARDYFTMGLEVLDAFRAADAHDVAVEVGNAHPSWSWVACRRFADGVMCRRDVVSTEWRPIGVVRLGM